MFQSETQKELQKASFQSSIAKEWAHSARSLHTICILSGAEMKKRVEQYYDRLSSNYDQATKSALSWQAPSAGLSLLSGLISPNSVVLDIGAGTGQTVELFANMGCAITAVDVSSLMLQKLKQKFPSVECINADIEDGLSEIEGRSFDLVVAIGVLEFVSDLGSVLKNVRKVLAAEGLFCFSTEELIVEHPLQNLKESPCG